MIQRTFRSVLVEFGISFGTLYRAVLKVKRDLPSKPVHQCSEHKKVFLNEKEGLWGDLRLRIKKCCVKHVLDLNNFDFQEFRT